MHVGIACEPMEQLRHLKQRLLTGDKCAQELIQADGQGLDWPEHLCSRIVPGLRGHWRVFPREFSLCAFLSVC